MLLRREGAAVCCNHWAVLVANLAIGCTGTQDLPQWRRPRHPSVDGAASAGTLQSAVDALRQTMVATRSASRVGALEQHAASLEATLDDVSSRLDAALTAAHQIEVFAFPCFE